MSDIYEQGLDEDAVRSVIGITHLAGADTVSAFERHFRSTILRFLTDRLCAEHVRLGNVHLPKGATEGTSRNRTRRWRGSITRLFGFE